MDKITLLIADDHTLVRQGLVALFMGVADIEVIGEAATGDEAIAKAGELKPEVILMDIQMPRPDGTGMNGIEATRRILQTQPGIGIVMVTMLDDDNSVFAAMRAGARGYILKGADKAEVLKTIRAVAAGEALFGPAIASRMMNFFREPPKTEAASPAFPELTEREREILTLIAQGQSNAAIARQLVISGKTVSNHISNIFNKLQVADRAQAAIRAREAGLE
jgi:DNA-binding NarL/FixJ family response regulator